MRTINCCLILCLTFAAVSTCWFSLDHSWPFWDAAQHLRDDFSYCALWHKLRPFSMHWWHSFLTVNSAYPPSVHAFNGFLKCLLGKGRWVDSASLVFFGVVLNFSVFALSMLLFEDVLVGILTVALINFYPLVSSLSHLTYLDFPELALNALAFTSLVWWYKRPTYRRAVLLGLSLALACTSKQAAAFFLIAPCIFLWLQLAFKKQKTEFLQLTLAGVMACTAFLLWVIPNFEGLRQYTSYNNIVTDPHQSFIQVYLSNLCSYCAVLPDIASPLLFTLFSCALYFFTRHDIYRKAWILITSGISGVLLLSWSTHNHCEARYIVTALIPIALLSAVFLAHLSRQRVFLKFVATAVVALAALQFLLINFSPYPIKLSTDQLRLLTCLACSANTCPAANGDQWGEEWIIDTITTLEHNRPIWVCVLSDSPYLNVHQLELITFYHNSTIKFTTPRRYSLQGDNMPDLLPQIQNRYCSWYIVKVNDSQDSSLDGTESRQHYSQALSELEKSSEYKLFAQRKLADGSELRLYRIM
jgi:hypothetical protein